MRTTFILGIAAFPAYAAPASGNAAAPGVYDFTNRAFGDGGYLDNKPFGHVTDVLQSRRGGAAVQRKLVFIEPSPEHPGDVGDAGEGRLLRLRRDCHRRNFEHPRDAIERLLDRIALVSLDGRRSPVLMRGGL